MHTHYSSIQSSRIPHCWLSCWIAVFSPPSYLCKLQKLFQVLCLLSSPIHVKLLSFLASRAYIKAEAFLTVDNIIPLTELHTFHINHICLNGKLAKLLNWNHSGSLLCSLHAFRNNCGWTGRWKLGKETQSAINNNAIGNNNKMPFEFNLFIIHWQVFK